MATESFNKTFVISDKEVIDRFIDRLNEPKIISIEVSDRVIHNLNESNISIRITRRDVIEESKKAAKVLASKLNKEI